LVDGYEETLPVSSGSGNLLERGGELGELGGGRDVPEKENHSSYSVGCDEGLDIFACFVTMEADNKELLPVSKNTFPHYDNTRASISPG
jgi:hypothetical protein